MASPSVAALGHLRKLIGFMKQMGDIGIYMEAPLPGKGKLSAGGVSTWLLQSYSDAEWSSNQSNRRSTSCGMHFLNGAFAYGSSSRQKVVSLSSCEN